MKKKTKNLILHRLGRVARGETKKPRNLRCEAVPSPGYVTVVAQRIRGLTGYHDAKINLIRFSLTGKNGKIKTR